MATHRLKTECAEQNRPVGRNVGTQNKTGDLWKKMGKVHIRSRTGTCRPGGNSDMAPGGTSSLSHMKVHPRRDVH